MKKQYVVLLAGILFLLSTLHIHAQSEAIDSFNVLINKSGSDTQRINLKIKKLKLLSNVNLDSAIISADSIVGEAKKINYKLGEARARIHLAGDYCFVGKYNAAKENLDITKKILSNTQDSEALAIMYGNYGMMYSMQNKFDTSHIFFKKSIEIARLRNDKSALSTSLQNNAIAFQQESNYPQALINYQQALNIAEQMRDEEDEAYIDLNIGITYSSLDENKRAEESYFKAIAAAQKLKLKNVLAYSYANLASLYGNLKDYSKQYDASMKAVVLGKEIGDQGIEAVSLSRAADALAKEDKFRDAVKLARQGMAIADSSRQPYNIFQVYETMGSIWLMQKKYDKAIPYFEKAFQSLPQTDIYMQEGRASYAKLSECYEKTGNFARALSAYKMSTKISDSIQGKENIKKATELTLKYEFQKSQQKIQDEQQKKNDLAKARQTALVIGLILTFFLAVVALRGFRNKRKANLLLREQKEKIESTLSELRSTQSHLIQSEKMASLGELTVGIAHEIQNPLNFVNNFSEVNTELLREMEGEIDRGNFQEVKAIVHSIIENEQKVSQHGKRADAIVKGMLQHSRTSTGIKEATDINALADEYLRLSYLGLRAKDNSFTASMQTDLDSSIHSISIIPQDIGRVLLNLYNNAFYAVSEKNKGIPGDYIPTVSVTTKKLDGKVELRVKDNGNGIPGKVIDKIFQPFFTTKAPGQGTGLGLSLSYDIVKAHGGEISVETREGEFTEFLVKIPAVQLNHNQ
jgi:two-component system, NtrC family, sensor kinase